MDYLWPCPMPSSHYLLRKLTLQDALTSFVQLISPHWTDFEAVWPCGYLLGM